MSIFIDSKNKVLVGEACTVQSGSETITGILQESTDAYVLIATDPNDRDNSLKQRIFYFKKGDWTIRK